MIKVISNCWALFFGMALIMLGSGLLGSLLGVRASLEGFGMSATGLVMSGYFIGMILGSQVVPKLVGRVGHIRIFGALASLASTVVLLHIVLIDPWAWWVMRVITGFAYAGLFVVAESWLNDASENETRGQLLSFYMLILLCSMAGGQFLLNIAPPSGFELFILISVLVGLAVIPILISVSQMPDFETTESVGILQLFKVSPLGVFGMLVSSISMGTIFGLGAVYGTGIGMSVKKISFFMGAIILGGALIQLPLGRLSDRLGRRRVIIGVCIAGAGVALVAPQFSSGWQIYLVAAALGALTTPLYSLCAAHTNDYLNPSQMVAASGALVLASGVGATMGPPLTAFAIDYFGSSDFFYYSIATFLGIVALYGVWRSLRRDALAREELGDFVMMAPTPISASFNPDVDLDELEAASEVDAREVQESFDDLAEELRHSSESS